MSRPKPPFYRRWWFWVIAAVVVLGAIGSLGDSGESATPTAVGSTVPAASSAGASAATSAAPEPAGGAPASTQAAPAPTKAKNAAVGLNSPVVDDDIEFTVTSFRCGVTATDVTGRITPQGKFCLLTVNAKNVGTKQVTISDSQIKLVDAGGAEYETSGDTLFVEGTLFLKKINPGNSITGKVYVDVPESVTPVQAVLQGGYFSRGAKVDLTTT